MRCKSNRTNLKIVILSKAKDPRICLSPWGMLS